MKQRINEEYKPLFTEHPRYFILMGGRGAGRSTVASQYANARLVAPEYFRCAIMRYILGDIRNSIYQEIKDRAEENEIKGHLSINDTLMSIKYGINTINAVGFKKSSGDQKAKLKSLANYNCIIIEEADEIPEADFMQLDDSIRTLKGNITIILLLNPPVKTHWIVKRWFDLRKSKVEDFYIPELKPHIKDTVVIRTSFLDNIKNISEQTIKNYREYRTTKPDHYWNMIRGFVPEVARGRIYPTWEIIDAIPKEARLKVKGLDFGYTNDPTALVDVYEWNNAYIVDELAFEKGLKNGQIAKLIGKETVITIADCAEPKSIAEISQHGIQIIGSKKGKGSISHGIDAVQSKKIYVTRRSVNIIDENNNYIFIVDKDGITTNQPRDLYNHSMDAIRYAIAFLNPKVDKPKEEDKAVGKYETPGLSHNRHSESKAPTPTLSVSNGSTHKERMNALLQKHREAKEDSYETTTPWQRPGAK